MRIKSKIYYVFAALAVAYICLTFIPYPDRATLARYHLSAGGLRVLDITIVVPLLVVWFAIFYGYERLHRYSQLIRKSKDGRAVSLLAGGLLALALGIALNSILSDILTLIAHHNPSFKGTATIITNYTAVFYQLVGFLLISVGARRLTDIAKTRPGLLTVNMMMLVAIGIGVVFCDLIARSHQDIHTTFHMSYSLVMLTLAIPYLYTWALGILAVIEIYLYSRRVAGVVYRKSWNQLAIGLGAVILVEIVLQYLGTLSSWVTGLSLSGLLLLLYVLLFLLAVAFIVVALGTKKLMKIEEA